MVVLASALETTSKGEPYRLTSRPVFPRLDCSIDSSCTYLFALGGFIFQRRVVQHICGFLIVSYMDLIPIIENNLDIIPVNVMTDENHDYNC